MTYRNKKLLQAAEDCPVCMYCGRPNTGGNIVPAHSNSLRHGRGVGFKTPDWAVAYVCSDPGGCHDRIDGRAGGLRKEQKRDMWMRAWEKTVAYWFEHGIVTA